MTCFLKKELDFIFNLVVGVNFQQPSASSKWFRTVESEAADDISAGEAHRTA